MYALYHHCNDKDNYHVNDDNDIVVDDDDDEINIDKDDNDDDEDDDDDDDDDKDGDDDLRLILPTTCMSLLNLSINNYYLKTNFTILCLYSSEADEMAMSQLFCILDTFAGFKRQNLYAR